MSVDQAIREWCDAITGDLATPIEAQKFVAHLRENAPDELAAWLDEHAAIFVCDRMGRYLGPMRARARAASSARRFQEQAAAHGSGDADAFSYLDVKFVIDDENTRRPLRDMRADDLRFAITDYESTATSNLMEAAWLKAIAKRITGKKTVGDVFTDAQLRALRQAAA